MCLQWYMQVQLGICNQMVINVQMKLGRWQCTENTRFYANIVSVSTKVNIAYIVSTGALSR